MKWSHRKNILLLFITFWSSPLLIAQGNFEQQTATPVQVNGQFLTAAWAGGINNPQFSAADLNNNGIQDLVIFDRGANQLLTFLHSGTTNSIDYQHDIEYQKNFPLLHDWALLIDMTCDGIPDICTAGEEDNIRVFQGYYTTQNQLAFNPLANSLNYGITQKPIKVSIYDIPAIVDVNEDGDVDILTFNSNGDFVEYFENQAIETNIFCDELNFALVDECWGNFAENPINSSLVLSQDCTEGFHTNNSLPNKSTVHPGSTLLVTDLDGQGGKEIILGDISTDSLKMLVNTGTLNNAVMTSQDRSFPSSTLPVNLRSFPAAFSLDVNHDGKKDMIVSPNATASSEHYSCAWYYKNVGNEEVTTFSYQQNDFMVNEMIDVTELAHPVFFDHNKDGLLDIIIGNQGTRGETGNFTMASLSLYENIGTSTAPAFKLISTNYMNISNQLVLNRLALKPTFGDLDNDGDEDMLLGDDKGYLHYFKNTPTTNGIAQFTLAQEQFQNIDVVQFSTPQLVDLNNNGLLDLVVGHKNGSMVYFQNMGTPENAVFEEVIFPIGSIFGGVDVKITGVANSGFAVPNFIFWKNEWLLFIGSGLGTIRQYNDIPQHLTEDIFNLQEEDILPNSNILKSSPAIADLDNDGKLDLIVGTSLGGLVWYEQKEAVGINGSINGIQELLVSYQIDQSTIAITLPNTATPNQLTVYNLTGQKVFEQKNAATKNIVEITTKNWLSGIYIITFESNQQKLIKKVFIL